MEVKGVFLQAISWEMTDERTGELRAGTTIRVGTMPDGSEFNLTRGFVIEKYTGASSLMGSIDQKMAGKPVTLQGELKPAGQGKFKFVPESIKLGTTAAAA